MTITLDGMRWFHQAATERIAKATAEKQAILALPKGSRGKAAKLEAAEAKIREEVGHRNEIDAVVRKAKQPLILAKVTALLEQVVNQANTLPLAAQVVAQSSVLRKVDRVASRTPFALLIGDGFRGVYCSVNYDEWGYPQYVELRPRANLEETVEQVERWKRNASKDETKAECDAILANPLDYVTYANGVSITVGLQSYWRDDEKQTNARYGINMSTYSENDSEEWYRSFEVIQVADRLRKELNQAALPRQHQWYNMLHDINVDIPE